MTRSAVMKSVIPVLLSGKIKCLVFVEGSSPGYHRVYSKATGWVNITLKQLQLLGVEIPRSEVEDLVREASARYNLAFVSGDILDIPKEVSNV